MSNYVFLNQNRVKYGPYASTDEDGMNGMFEFTVPGDPRRIRCIGSDGSGLEGTPLEGMPRWQHVSVSFGPDAKKTPSWELMCHIKDLFWEPDDVVIQFHQAKKYYVNFHKHCLHLWRAVDAVQPVPPSIYVGPK